MSEYAPSARQGSTDAGAPKPPRRQARAGPKGRSLAPAACRSRP